MSALTESAKNPSQYAKQFATLELTGSTRYLAYRDLPQIIKEHVEGTKVLDYGCGGGIAINILQNQGLQVDGVDILPEMIQINKERDPLGNYWLIQSGEIPTAKEYYDLVHSSYVFMYVATKEEMLIIFNKIARVLKPNGCFIISVCSENLFKVGSNWLTIDTQFKENENPTSGVLIKIALTDLGLIQRCYFWTEADYREVCERSEFTMEKIIYPLGREDDGFKWAQETEISPVVIFVMKKKANVKVE